MNLFEVTVAKFILTERLARWKKWVMYFPYNKISITDNTQKKYYSVKSHKQTHFYQSESDCLQFLLTIVIWRLI